MLSSIILIVRLVGELGVSSPRGQDVLPEWLSPLFCVAQATRCGRILAQARGSSRAVIQGGTQTSAAFREKRRRFLYREQGLNVAAMLNSCLRVSMLSPSLKLRLWALPCWLLQQPSFSRLADQMISTSACTFASKSMHAQRSQGRYHCESFVLSTTGVVGNEVQKANTCFPGVL